MRIAILALQGAFAEHKAMLERLGAETFEVRQAADWAQPKDGLVLPGGESTVMLKLLHELNLFEPIRDAIRGGLPVMGTCAGLILLSEEIENKKSAFPQIGTMRIKTCRNGYGRQLGSFFTEAAFQGIASPVPMTFIRAPYIKEVGNGVEVLARIDGNIVAAREGKQLVTSFHPELNEDPAIHQLFLQMAAE
ncbi:MAG: pyridoxal 5'-phosphate synthase glutaminase subunit PdxT [Prevotella sp.]|nr:pyridoxal 5'-phosphate synthase glutaminase subunit PdxT [Prevotella sp.]MDD7272799.1 pyridoxal 5'-phosphate synthase glutaminase subunit PdxT [Prevotellaceae bacterium]MDY3936603.1 pyridoxal 5'-phosphate synthase glutaminase subunit PdxT [Prevotella sp.]MDY4218461.1 pyridoxal 5'-phosphate synthase glutaminase subunit PdxT [Prevotella sp.]